ncbi:hypothetical protein SLEP1_g18708 [Rubroshorea leprosula]|uniref:Secreted protein n=1 Tax=Rubroshorea leprosula TaxID=152421 RepID=A0AAV5J413_9ROSI|nr:hypothetical protein SLEP1_g18708 [Rubroshorea leprosula]
MLLLYFGCPFCYLNACPSLPSSSLCSTFFFFAVVFFLEIPMVQVQSHFKHVDFLNFLACCIPTMRGSETQDVRNQGQ